MNHKQFKEMQPQLTTKLAEAFETKLKEMGEDTKGISWFSSIAEEYNNDELRLLTK